MKKKVFLLGVVSAGALAVSLLMVNATSNNDSFAGNYISHSQAGEPGSYVLSFSGTNLPATITTSFQNSFAGTIKTAKGNDINLTYSNVRVNENMVQVAGHGRIYNYGASNTKISGIDGVAFTGQGSLIFRPVLSDGTGKGYVVKEQAVVIAANAAKVDVPVCDYFELEAADGGAALSGLELSYSCDATTSNINLLDGTYTGVGSDSYTYKLVVSNGTASIETLDRQTKIQLSGTAVMLDKDTAKCTFVYNTYNIYYTMDFNGHSFTFVSKSDDVGGAAAAQVAEVNFDRVYNVEDFESYTATGAGYVSATAKYQTTGMRANYYADYYTGSSTGEIGGSGWPIMTSTDNSNWRNNKGRNASAGGIFKFSNNMGMRYIAMNELYGVKSIIGKGATLSFWVRGAYTSTNFNTDATANTPMKLYAFYDSPLTPSNQTTVRETFDFTVNAGSEWQHFEMPLTAGRNYYGFGLYAKQTSGATQFVPFDDIQIYTASPYAEYVAPVAVTGVTVAPTQLDLVVGGQSQLTATVAPEDATNKNVSWSSNATSVATVDADGTVHALASGSATITATTQDGGFTSTCSVTVSAPSVIYPEGTYKGTAVVNGNNFEIVLAIGNQTNGLIAVRLSNKDAVATDISFDQSTLEVTIHTTGDYSSMTYGTITGVYDPDNNRITNVTCAGTIASYVSNNGEIVCEKAVTSDTSFFADCEGTTGQLQSQFKRRYMSGSWQVDTGNADRITSDTTNFVSGGGAVKRRGYSGGAVALNLNNDYSPAKTMRNIHFWVYNPSSNANIKLRVWVYTSNNFATNAEVISGGFSIAANGWTYCSVGYSSSTIYNFQIADFTNSGVYLTFDNIYLF